MIVALPNKYFLDLGLYLPGELTCLISRTAEVSIGMPGGVEGLLSNGGSYPDMSFFESIFTNIKLLVCRCKLNTKGCKCGSE